MPNLVSIFASEIIFRLSPNMDQFNYIQLLSKQLAGESLVTHEQKSLEDWIQESPDHARIADQYQRVWNEVPDDYGAWTDSVDLDAEYAALEARMAVAQKPAAPVVVKVNWQRQLMRAAAAVAFLIVGWMGYRMLNDQSEMIYVKATTDNQAITLPDGSKVWLRENASIEYPSNIVSAKARKVKLNGEAFFEVTHDVEHPFSVITAQGNAVEVLGTQFDVKSGESTTEVLVKSGKVRFAPDEKQQGRVIMAGNKAVLDRNNAKMVISSVQSYNDLAWQAGGLEFINTPLEQVVSDLESYYKVDIQLNNHEISDCTYTSPLVNQSIEDVLNSLAVSFQLKVDNPERGKFILSGGSCN